jgi:endonuclease/exonuclease/phosphatase family metal-dependent hydrolase
MRLAIWNMQGGNNYDQAATLLAQDYVCLQECGTPPDNWGIALPPGAGNGVYTGQFQRNINHQQVQFRSTYYRWRDPTSVNPNFRCSQLIVSRAVTITAPLVVPDPNNPNGRPVLGREVAADCWVFSVHSPSMGTNNAHLLQIQAQMNAVQNAVAVAARWVVAGDFNYMANNNAIDTAYGNRIVRGPHATQQGGGILDYVITGPNALTLVEWTGQAQVSDHYAQYFRLDW